MHTPMSETVYAIWTRLDPGQRAHIMSTLDLSPAARAVAWVLEMRLVSETMREIQRETPTPATAD